MKYLVTVNRNLKFSTQVSVDADYQEAAEKKALSVVDHLPIKGLSRGSIGDWDINEDSGEFVSYLEAQDIDE